MFQLGGGATCPHLFQQDGGATLGPHLLQKDGATGPHLLQVGGATGPHLLQLGGATTGTMCQVDLGPDTHASLKHIHPQVDTLIYVRRLQRCGHIRLEGGPKIERNISDIFLKNILLISLLARRWFIALITSHFNVRIRRQ